MPPPDPDAFTMSFGDHLDELRRRLIYALAAPIPLFIVAFFFSGDLVEIALKPLWHVLDVQHLPMEVQVLSPPEMIMTQLKLSAIVAVTISAPWILWQLWQFVAPGLYAHEQRFVRFLMPGSAILTVTGVALLYFVMLPLMLHVLVMFAQDIGTGQFAGGEANPPPVVEALQHVEHIDVRVAPPADPEPGQCWLLVPDMRLDVVLPADTLPNWEPDEGATWPEGVQVVRVNPSMSSRVKQVFRVSEAVNFTLILMLGTVVAFQMPLVIMLLGWLGLATPRFLRSQRRIALAICGLLSAILTPADATSMLIMLVPLYGLYELGIMLMVLAPAHAVAEGRIWRFGKPPRRRRPSTTGDNPAADASQSGEPAQTDAPMPRPDRSSQPRGESSESDDAQ